MILFKLIGESRSKKDEWLLLLLIGITITLPYRIDINNIFIGCFIIAWLLSGGWNVKYEILKNNKLALLLIALFIITILGLLYSEDLTKGLKLLERRLTFLIFPLIICSSTVISKKSLPLLLFSFVFTISAGCIYSHTWVLFEVFHYDYSFIQLVQDKYTHTNLANYIGLHPTYFSMYITFAVIILIFFFNSVSSSWKKLLVACLFIYLIIFNFLLASRIGLIILFTFLVIYIIYMILKQKRLKLGLSLLLIIFSSVFLIRNLFPEVERRLYKNPKEVIQMDSLKITTKNFRRVGSILYRLQIYDCATELITPSSFFLGYGTGDVKKQLQNCYHQKKYGWVAARDFNTHNQYFDQVLRHGILGLIIFLSCLIIPFKLSLEYKDYVFLFFIILFSLTGLTENLLSVQKGIVFFSLFMSIYIAKVGASEL